MDVYLPDELHRPDPARKRRATVVTETVPFDLVEADVVTAPVMHLRDLRQRVIGHLAKKRAR
jgi:hypothetical protein